MKILLIVDDITTIGGAERVVVNLANAFSAMRFDSSKFAGGGSHKLKSYLQSVAIKM